MYTTALLVFGVGVGANGQKALMSSCFMPHVHRVRAFPQRTCALVTLCECVCVTWAGGEYPLASASAVERSSKDQRGRDVVSGPGRGSFCCPATLQHSR
jgi:hypothetical protein